MVEAGDEGSPHSNVNGGRLAQERMQRERHVILVHSRAVALAQPAACLHVVVAREFFIAPSLHVQELMPTP